MATTPNPATSTAMATATMATSIRPTTTTTTTISSTAKTPPRAQAPQPHPYYLYASQNLPRGAHPTPNHSSSLSSSPTPRQHLSTGLYPVSSSGRGYVPRPTRPPDPPRTGGCHPRSLAHSTILTRQHPTASGPPHWHHPQHHLQQLHHVQLPYPHHHGAAIAAVGVGPAPIKGIPISAPLKAVPSPSAVSESNGYRNLRDNTKDDALVTVRDRKVRITDGASLYLLCRSWLRNGFPEENQSLYGDGIKALPRPSSPPVADLHSPRDEVFEEDEEDEESVTRLSTEDLLKIHIRRAKKVRARLREGRLKRIARYKARLALLLPPQVDQFRNDTAAGN